MLSSEVDSLLHPLRNARAISLDAVPSGRKIECVDEVEALGCDSDDHKQPACAQNFWCAGVRSICCAVNCGGMTTFAGELLDLLNVVFVLHAVEYCICADFLRHVELIVIDVEADGFETHLVKSAQFLPKFKQISTYSLRVLYGILTQATTTDNGQPIAGFELTAIDRVECCEACAK